MKFKALAASFLASAALAGCGAPTPEQAAANRAEAQASAYDVKCYSPAGAVTFEGEAKDGISSDISSTSRNVVIKTLDGRSFEQYGGYCTALKRG